MGVPVRAGVAAKSVEEKKRKPPLLLLLTWILAESKAVEEEKAGAEDGDGKPGATLPLADTVELREGREVERGRPVVEGVGRERVMVPKPVDVGAGIATEEEALAPELIGAVGIATEEVLIPWLETGVDAQLRNAVETEVAVTV